MGSWTCTCNAHDGSNWACACNSQGGSNWWTCVEVYDSFYLLNDACPANQSSWTDPTLSNTIKIKAQHINELRTSINGEQGRRHTTPHNFGTSRSSADKVTRVDTQTLRDQIEALHPFTGSWVYNYNTISKIEAAILTEVRTNLNDSENDCLCNCNYCTCQCNYCTCNCNYCTCDCNYCTCDCNYCTCDCNYCTCNCNYCTCNCNYSCTCNCNYSDEELKEEISYM